MRAHRMSTASPCAFCEHRGHPTCLPARPPTPDETQNFQPVTVSDPAVIKFFAIQDFQVQLDRDTLARDIQFAQQFSDCRPCPTCTRLPIQLHHNGFYHPPPSNRPRNLVVNKPAAQPAPLPLDLRRSHNIIKSDCEIIKLDCTPYVQA